MPESTEIYKCALRPLPELLAPAGSPEALAAALDGGADAVYLGGRLFNARMNARNFDDAELARAVGMCSVYGAKLYVTLNTLLSDRELDEAVRYAAFLYQSGVDALIVADLGLARLLRRYLPGLELHASTQLSAHSTPGVRLLADLGFKRVVVARELSREDICAICANSGVEIEVFAHGAHCVSHSGMCLFSSLVGGRSGNRGLCAQPCRLPYSVDGGRPSYPLSLKDMCLAGHIRELCESGVRSLKLEGRMKPPAYVYTVTSVYRRLLDERRDASPAEVEKLRGAFSRGGFTDGYFTGKLGPSMRGVRSEDDKKRSETYKYFPSKKAVDARKVQVEFFREVSLPEEKFTPEAPKVERGRSLSAQFLATEQIPERLAADAVFLPSDRFSPRADGVVLPPVTKDGELSVLETQLRCALSVGARRLMAQNIGQLGLCFSLAREFDAEVWLGLRLNIYNSGSAAALSELAGDVRIVQILSPELLLPQMRDVRADAAAVVYGRLPLMTLELRTGARRLTDRENVVFPVLQNGPREEIYNSAVVWMADRAALLERFNIFRRHMIFTDESVSECTKILGAYSAGSGAPPKNIRRMKEKN